MQVTWSRKNGLSKDALQWLVVSLNCNFLTTSKVLIIKSFTGEDNSQTLLLYLGVLSFRL